MLFQGQEWISSSPFPFFTSWDDPKLAEKIRAGRRSDFEKDGQDAASMLDPNDPMTFDLARLQWDELDCEPHHSMLDYYRSLLALRKREGLRAGALPSEVQFDEDERWVAYERLPGSFVVLNFSDVERRIPLERCSDATEVIFESEVSNEPLARCEAGFVTLRRESAALVGVSERDETGQ